VLIGWWVYLGGDSLGYWPGRAWKVIVSEWEGRWAGWVPIGEFRFILVVSSLLLLLGG
jgi:hypothetical protein